MIEANKYKYSLNDLYKLIFFICEKEYFSVSLQMQTYLVEFFNKLIFELFLLLKINLFFEFFFFFQNEQIKKFNSNLFVHINSFFFCQFRFQFFSCWPFLYKKTFHSLLFYVICGYWLGDSEKYNNLFYMVYFILFYFSFQSIFWLFCQYFLGFGNNKKLNEM